MGNRNVTSAQKDHKSVGKRQPCERFLSLRLDRLLVTDRDRHSTPHAYHIRPEYWWHDTSWTPAGRISDDCRISGVDIHHGVVLPVHSSCATHLRVDVARHRDVRAEIFDASSVVKFARLLLVGYGNGM